MIISPYTSLQDAIPKGLLVGISGIPGAGKSTFATSILSKLHPSEVAFFEAEPGAYTAALQNKQAGEWLAKRDVPEMDPTMIFPVRTWTDFKDTLYATYLNEAKRKGEPVGVRAIVADSLTKLSQYLVRERNPWESKAPIAEWGKIKDEWAFLFFDLLQAGYIFVGTYHLMDMLQKPDVTPKEKRAQVSAAADREMESLILPDIAGAARMLLIQDFHWVLYLERATNDIIIHTRTQNDLFGKMRSNFEPREVNRSLGEMLEQAGALAQPEAPKTPKKKKK